ncbi:MAG: hypothetical protein JWN25_120 [Verrucomicrobiales bacterium]|nr:hypothetical protein [Verrucomicrobiales bacterium]
MICKTLLLFLLSTALLPAREVNRDVVVFGASSGGIAAAIQAARMHKSVILVEPGKTIGGLTTGGLGATDIGNKAAIGGISREFYRRLGKYYHEEESWKFEPHVADMVFHQMLKEEEVSFELNQKLKSVTMDGNRILSFSTEDGNVYKAKIFIDATYEGDLMAKSGVSYHVGREANSVYGETLNGIRAKTPKHQFTVPVDPYLKPGVPSSGLLPLIQPGDGGVPGEGDKRIQTYNFRLCFTTNATNRITIERPAGYDPARFELLGRYFEALLDAGKKPQLKEFWNPIWMPNEKTDINNNGGFSTDFIGANYDYADGDYATREKIWKEHEIYTRGFLYYMRTSPRVPQYIRDEMATWGPCRDEFQETGGWPNQLYVREARRMISDFVMTEAHCRGEKVGNPVGLAAYNMDSHNCQRIVRNGHVENEGDVQVPPMKPYPVSYFSIVPREKECSNLLVPVCLAASHIAYGSIRMEPVFMILGQSAATAACLAMEERRPVQKISQTRLERRLREDKQILEWKQPIDKTSANASAIPLPGVLLDDGQAIKKGDWVQSQILNKSQIGSTYIHDGNVNKGDTQLTFNWTCERDATYIVSLVAPPLGNRDTRVPVRVSEDGKELKKLTINEQETATGGIFKLGAIKLHKGGQLSVTVSNEGTTNYVVVDGLQIVPVAKSEVP